MLLSKTDYMLGVSCIKALWLKYNRPDLEPEIDEALQRRFDIGKDVQEYARLLYPKGIMVESLDLQHAAWKTNKLSEQYDVLFEATALFNNEVYCRIDILERDGNAWNLVEIKSATSVKPEYIIDLAFQKYVFEKAGYKINRCQVIYLNNQYERMGDLDIQHLFTTEDVTEKVLEKSFDIEQNVKDYIQIITKDEEPEATLHKSDPCKSCAYFQYCKKDLPNYSILNLFEKDKDLQAFYQDYQSYKVEDVPEDYSLNDREIIDKTAYLNQEIYVESKEIQKWLNQLVYPLYYLDYETAQLAIPLFDKSNPYNQIPFQFSLHVQKKQGGEVKHISFLHKNKSDPRRDLAECLVKSCGTKGSVIVYNKTFEMTRNKELAELFPDLADKIYVINERIIDQLDIFKKRYLYSPKQKGSASIKYVLPAFCDLSYQGMEIANGSEAMSKYEAFLKGKQTPEETKAMLEALEKYCCQDTLAMVLLMDVIYQYAHKI